MSYPFWYNISMSLGFTIALLSLWAVWGRVHTAWTTHGNVRSPVWLLGGALFRAVVIASLGLLPLGYSWAQEQGRQEVVRAVQAESKAAEGAVFTWHKEQTPGEGYQAPVMTRPAMIWLVNYENSGQKHAALVVGGRVYPLSASDGP